MKTPAAIGMLVATAALIGLFVAVSRGLPLPPRLFRPRTWLRAAAWTLLFGTAATFGATLAGSGLITTIAITATGFLLALELLLWTKAFTFGPRDR